MKTITIKFKDNTIEHAHRFREMLTEVMHFLPYIHMLNVEGEDDITSMVQGVKLEPPPKDALKKFKEKSKRTEGAAQARAHILHDMADLPGFTTKDVRKLANRYGIDEKQVVNSLHHLVTRGDVVKSGGTREKGYTYRVKVVDAPPLPNSGVAYP